MAALTPILTECRVPIRSMVPAAASTAVPATRSAARSTKLHSGCGTGARARSEIERGLFCLSSRSSWDRNPKRERGRAHLHFVLAHALGFDDAERDAYGANSQPATTHFAPAGSERLRNPPLLAASASAMASFASASLMRQ